MEIVKCKCGKSEVEFEVVGEDLWAATLSNAKCKTFKEDGVDIYVCNSCSSEIDRSDTLMMVKH